VPPVTGFGEDAAVSLFGMLLSVFGVLLLSVVEVLLSDFAASVLAGGFVDEESDFPFCA
jgi:uncharacterized membrane protein